MILWHCEYQNISKHGDCWVAVPSANRFGILSPATASHVTADFADEKELYILNCGSYQADIESTIIAYLNGELSLLRPG